MAESSFAFDFAEEVLRKLGSLPYQDMSLACCLERDVDKLEDTLLTIKAVILDAEEKQVENRELTNWLGMIKDVCYYVDDVFDEFQYEASWRQLVKRGSIKRKVCNFFSHSNPLAVCFKMGRAIKEIRSKLDEIEAEKVKFELTVKLRGGQIICSARDTRFCNFSSLSNPLAFHFKLGGKIQETRLMLDENIEAKNVKSKHKKQVIDGRVVHVDRETHSFVQTSDVIGRDVDKQNIITLLMHPSANEKISIIPIVGLGGLGKSTLAKLVYNDEMVDGHFQLKMWVCVSEDFDVKELTKKILNSATSTNSSELNLEQMRSRLGNSLSGKIFLLILDDVWNQDHSKWVGLRNLLTVGANGSKIIVTTRSQSVASIMGTVPPYNLEPLPHDKCLSLFVKCAFRDGEEKEYPKLLEIADEIVRKCGGVPTAVRTLGSLLYSKRHIRDWLFVKDNEIWKLEQKENDILPALRLSYDAMPPYLKQCFAFCSIFPKDYEFSSIELIYLWMAHNFLPLSNRNQEPEDVGQQCINELWSRSFFQDFDEVLGGRLRGFKMHDLVHDLALLVAEGECSTHGSFRTHNISNRLQHVSFFEDDSSEKEVLSTLSAQQCKNVRTILCRKDSTSDSLMETCLPRFNHLRVLDLSDSQIEVLPNSVGKLKHLRYLSLLHNDKIKKLPNSICKLVNLQTLNLNGCEDLEELPKDIGNLIRLRCLFLTTKQIVLPEKGIGCLTSLRFLYIGDSDNLKSLGEGMRSLTALRTLIIESCNHLESLPRSIKCLTALETLGIADCEKLNFMDSEGDIQGLRLGLQFFILKMVPKLVALPPWLQGAAETLQTIQIEDCLRFKELPKWLEYLTSLQKLVIEDCPRLSSLPEEMHHLTALRELKIEGCPKLRRRCKQETGEDWPKIAHIQHITLDEINFAEDEEGEGEGEGEGEEEEEVTDSSVSSSNEVPRKAKLRKALKICCLN